MRYEQNRVQVELLGETFTVKGAASKEEIEKTAVYLTDLFDQMRERLPTLSQKGLAVLTAFSMAEELLRLRRDYDDLAAILDKD